MFAALYISPINRKENIEEPRLFSRHIMEAVRQNNGSVGGFVKYAVILTGGNHISHDHHSQQDHGQQDIGVRQLDMEQFVLPLCAFQHMGSPSMKTCRARAVTSKGWAFHSTRSASLPTCREPLPVVDAQHLGRIQGHRLQRLDLVHAVAGGHFGVGGQIVQRGHIVVGGQAHLHARPAEHPGRFKALGPHLVFGGAAMLGPTMAGSRFWRCSRPRRCRRCSG